MRRPVFIGDFSALERRQRILDEDALAIQHSVAALRSASRWFAKELADGYDDEIGEERIGGVSWFRVQ